MKQKVLCVDDEPNLLRGIGLHLRRDYEVFGATNGNVALQLIQSKGPFAVVLSDYRMPGMNGATFLSEVKRLYPDTVRMMFTGHMDIKAAVEAINSGQIMRFLLKPCSPVEIKAAFQVAVKQHELIISERELLEKTLLGSVQALVDTLSLANPLAFGFSSSVKSHVSSFLDVLNVSERWPIEIASMIFHVGVIALPESIAFKFYHGNGLDTKEIEAIKTVPSISAKLISNIPRLEPVVSILENTYSLLDLEEIPLGSKILRIVSDYEFYLHNHSNKKRLFDDKIIIKLILGDLLQKSHIYDSELVKKFEEVVLKSSKSVIELPYRELQIGMKLANDITTKRGVLLVRKGFKIGPGFFEKMSNYSDCINEPIVVEA